MKNFNKFMTVLFAALLTISYSSVNAGIFDGFAKKAQEKAAIIAQATAAILQQASLNLSELSNNLINGKIPNEIDFQECINNAFTAELAKHEDDKSFTVTVNVSKKLITKNIMPILRPLFDKIKATAEQQASSFKETVKDNVNMDQLADVASDVFSAAQE